MKKKRIILIVTIVAICVFLAGITCHIRNENNKIKYVFLFIGDGMSLPQVDATEIYNNSVKGNSMDKQEQLQQDINRDLNSTILAMAQDPSKAENYHDLAKLYAMDNKFDKVFGKRKSMKGYLVQKNRKECLKLFEEYKQMKHTLY